MKRKTGKNPKKNNINLHVDQRIWAIYKLWAIQEMTTVTSIVEQAMIEFVLDNVSQTLEELEDAEYVLKDVLKMRKAKVFNAKMASMMKDRYPGMLTISNRDKRVALRAARDERESNVAGNVA